MTDFFLINLILKSELKSEQYCRHQENMDSNMLWMFLITCAKQLYHNLPFFRRGNIFVRILLYENFYAKIYLQLTIFSRETFSSSDI